MREVKAMKHPESKEGEVLLGNAVDDGSTTCFETARPGINALDDDGNIIPGQIPVFVQETELSERGIIVVY